MKFDGKRSKVGQGSKSKKREVRVTRETVGTIDQRGYSGTLAQIGIYEKKRVTN